MQHGRPRDPMPAARLLRLYESTSGLQLGNRAEYPDRGCQS
jgi:hypothetical protein